MSDTIRFDIVPIGQRSTEGLLPLGVVATAGADFVVILELEVAFLPDGVDILADALRRLPEFGVLYFDEYVRGADGGLALLARPVLSPERLRCQNYLGTVVVYTAAAYARLGGIRDDLEPRVAAYDLALRAARDQEIQIDHRQIAPFVTDASGVLPLSERELAQVRSVLQEHLDATGGGSVESVGADGVHRTHRAVRGEPFVSIVIPTRGLFRDGGGSYLVDAIRGIVTASTYRNVELVVVHDRVAEPEVLAQVAELAGERLVLVEWSAPFNFSAKINYGVVHSSGEYVLILNDDIDVITPGWIEDLLALAQLPGAGMSGCMLYYEDESIQHAGHHYWRGDAKHIAMFVARGDPGPLSGLRVEREVSGVTAACAMMPRAVYDEVGGMTNLLPNAFNDVDLCLKVSTAGYRIYWTPYAELFHFESKTRDPTVRKWEVDTAWGRWGRHMHDPRYWPYAD